MSEEAFHLKFQTVPGASHAINRILRKQRPLPERGMFAALTLLGVVTGWVLVLLLVSGIALVMIFLSGALSTFFSTYFSPRGTFFFQNVLFLMPFIIVVLIALPWIQRVVRSTLEVDEPPSEQELVIDTRGIIAMNENSSSIVTWSAVERVVSDPQNIFLFLGKRRAFVIPRSALDPAEADRLIALAERSRSGQVASPPFRSDWVTSDAA